MSPAPQSIGTMRQRITFQTVSGGTDAQGFPNTGYADYVTVWANVDGGTPARIYAKEFDGAGAVQSENDLIFTVRYREDLDASMRVIYRGQPFAIIGMVDKDGLRTWLSVMVKGWQSGGV
ncbi:phage head closure protein [Alicyclobacillus sp. ALC3]|uniref:phage head closure protein n=1 Tax=Alicyclobacillus sp. ALC3 TaxID=2796143 RepID=UPI0023793831|nr:phage head closure protein [Alicyclobacillus sp. ALC3]WDL98128.1 phage head closure protein [Alicyclobacillus sp. ALC3]